jgi:hypothetical protein
MFFFEKVVDMFSICCKAVLKVLPKNKNEKVTCLIILVSLKLSNTTVVMGVF